MDFIDFLSSWRCTTSHFTSNALWNSRLSKLGVFSESDLRTYWKSLQTTDCRSSERLLLQLSQITNTIKDGKHSFIEHQIANDLCHFTRIAIREIDTPISFSESSMADVYDAILLQLESVISDTLSFEHQVFVSAFPNEDSSFEYFVNQITRKKEWLEYILQSYPVLCGQLIQFQENYKLFILQFCERIKSDIENLCKEFKIPDTARNLIGIRPFCGDLHRKGNSTISLILSNPSGELHKFYYKPKSLSTDVVWNAIITRLWHLGLRKTVFLTTNIDKGCYGWQKEEEADLEVTSADELKSFCFNQGVNIALAYILGVQDLIADNILVKRDLPVFFDLEMLFSPISTTAGDYLTKSTIAKRYLQGVIKTGLIPCFGFETLNQTGFDNSGLCINSGKKNTPNFGQNPFYSQELLNGFDYACNFINTHRKEFVKILREEVKGNPLLQTRYLVRFTFNYAQLFRALYSPFCQGEITQHHLTLENLWRGYNKNVLNEDIIQDEIRQIFQGDIPLFTTFPNCTNLYNENGDLLVRDYFQCSGLEASIQRIENFSEKEACIQKDVIKRALYIHSTSNSLEDLSSYINMDKLKNLDLVSQIAYFLYSLPQEEDPMYFTYVDYTISKDDIWDQGVQHLDFFQGVTGVGVFFMAWYKYSHDIHAKTIINKIYNQAIEYLRNNRYVLLDSPVVKLGVMNFPTSILYYYIMGYKILGDECPILADEDLALILDYIEKKYTKDNYIDYFSGSTGLSLILIELFNVRPSKRLQQVILHLGNHLLQSASIISPQMTSWDKKTFSLWGGFAHGNSSISYALFKLWSFTGEEKFYLVAVKALAYDQALFDSKKQCWKKTLSIVGDIHHSWGNGSAGIGLSRHLISPYFENTFMKQEIMIVQRLIKQNITERTYTDHSVASGLLGLLEIGKILDESFPAKDFLKSELGNYNLSDLQCGGWKGNPVVTGLYYGYAGIGYNLLKLQNLPELPSLLWI